ncbi:MAG: hypothetical protein AB1813_00340 [Verrucomicrobiota bacterium]
MQRTKQKPKARTQKANIARDELEDWETTPVTKTKSGRMSAANYRGEATVRNRPATRGGQPESRGREQSAETELPDWDDQGMRGRAPTGELRRTNVPSGQVKKEQSRRQPGSGGLSGQQGQTSRAPRQGRNVGRARTGSKGRKGSSAKNAAAKAQRRGTSKATRRAMSKRSTAARGTLSGRRG